MKPAFAIIGAGRVGYSLASALHASGYHLTGVYSRTKSTAAILAKRLNARTAKSPEELAQKADLVFITTPDSAIADTAENIARKGGFHQGQFIYHTCGALTTDVLLPAQEQGAWIGSIHPLQSFANTEEGETQLKGTYFALAGDYQALSMGKTIIRDLQGHSFQVPEKDRPIYHAAACIASNYLVALVHWAINLYQRFGLSEEAALAALKPLLTGTVSNLVRLGPMNALTGPISRGDNPTIAKHLAALKASSELEQNLYRDLGLYTAQLALQKGSINNEKISELSELLLHTK